MEFPSSPAAIPSAAAPHRPPAPRDPAAEVPPQPLRNTPHPLLGTPVEPWKELDPPGRRCGDPPVGIEPYAARPTVPYDEARARLEDAGARLTEPTTGRLGRRLEGLDGRAVTPELADALRALVWEHQLVAIGGQQLDDDQLLAFARTIGQPQIYYQSNYHHPRHPEVFVSSNVPMDGRKVGVANTGAFWHSDYQMFREPLPMTLVTPRQVPSGARGTLYVDMAAAYERLPDPVREWVDATRCVHEVRWRYKVQPKDIDKSITQILQEHRADTPPVTHPTAITQPINGRKCVYVSRGFTVGVEGYGVEESHRMLSELLAVVEQPEHTHCQLWTLGDCLLWDNRQLIHMSRPGTPGEASVSYRIGVHDGRVFNADEPQGGRAL